MQLCSDPDDSEDEGLQDVTENAIEQDLINVELDNTYNICVRQLMLTFYTLQVEMFWISKVFFLAYTYLHMQLIYTMFDAYPLYAKKDTVFLFNDWGHFCLEKQGKLKVNLENSSSYDECTFEGRPDAYTV